jgi:hypothetical protein
MKPPTKHHRGAFTLVELAALTAIGFVVCATFLPALASTRTRSAAVSCAANQKQLALALSLYAADNADSLLPSELWRNPSGVTVPLTGGGYWAGPIPGIPFIAPGAPVQEALQRVRAGLTNAPLWRYAANEEIYHCPSDARFRLRMGQGWAFDSYSKVNGMGGQRDWESSQIPFRRLSDVSDPALSFLFLEESDPRGSNVGTWVLSVSVPGWVDPLATWHDTGSNSVYADGHQDYHRWTDARTIQAARSGDRGVAAFSWAGGNASNPDFRWVRERYRYEKWKPLPN